MDKRIRIIQEGALGTRASWDEYGIVGAIKASTRSSCWNVHAGCEITDERHQSIGSGYNGAPGKIKRNCLETGCRKELKGLDYETSLGSGECIGVHAELNAVGHLSKRDSSRIIVYNTIFPCHTCAKDLLSYELSRLVFKRAYSEKEIASTMDMFEEAGVEVSQLDLSPERFLDIYFNHPDVRFDVWSADEKARIAKLLGVDIGKK